MIARDTDVKRRPRARVQEGSEETVSSATLRRELKSGRDLVQAIRTGFEADLLAAAGEYFEVPAARIRAITRVPDTTAHRLVKRHALLDASASERLWRLADVAARH